MPVASENVRVLCVGVNAYEDDCVAITPDGKRIEIFTDLSYCEDDALAMAKMADELYGYTVRTLVGEQATASAIREGLRWLGSAGPDGAAIFYFSGHGCTVEGKQEVASRRGAYLIPYGTRLREAIPDTVAASEPAAGVAVASTARVPRRGDALTATTLEARAVPIQEVVDALHGAMVRHRLVIVDACCSGYEIDGITARGGDGFEESRYVLFERPSKAVLTAGTELQEAHERPNDERDAAHPYLGVGRGHGYFTAELIRVLSDRSSNALATAEVHARVHNATHKASGGIGALRESSPQYRSRENGSFVWVKKPPASWLREVVREVRKSDAERAGRGKGAGGSARGRSAGALAAPPPPGGRKPKTQILRENESRLDLLAAAAKAAEIRVEGKQELGEDVRWASWRDRCVLKAAGGDPDAMVALHFAYKYGIAVPADARAARSWAAEGLDSGDPVARLVYEQAQALGGRLDDGAFREAELAERRSGVVALGGTLVAMEGVRQGNPTAAAAGFLAMGTGLALLMGKDDIDSVMRDAVQARAALAEEFKKTRTRDAQRINSLLNKMKVAAQRLEELASNDTVDSVFYELAPAVCFALNEAAARLGDPRSRRGRSETELLADVLRRWDELAALYLARRAVEERERLAKEKENR